MNKEKQWITHKEKCQLMDKFLITFDTMHQFICSKNNASTANKLQLQKYVKRIHNYFFLIYEGNVKNVQYSLFYYTW